jgi:16S rRNA (cytosine967-C5)-methyltransferase
MNLRKIATEILDRLHSEKILIDLLLDQTLEKHTLNPRDRNFIFELVHGTIRWQKKLEWIARQFFVGDYAKAPRPIKNIIESSLYQILYMTRTPDYAIVNEAVQLAKRKKGAFWGRFVNGVLRNILRNLENLKLPEIEKDPIQGIAVSFSHPEWLIERWLPRFGIQETIKLCEVNNQTPWHSLRVNQNKITPEALQALLTKEGVEAALSPVLPGFLRAQHLPVLSGFKLFQDGFFTIQDESAALVGLLLNPKPGETILDLCAAPGGKTTHLAELTNDRAIIIAVDQAWPRLKKIQENQQRLRFRNIIPLVGNALDLEFKPVMKILLDVPCSGLGVLAKRADLRWQRSPDKIQELQKIQLQLLNKAATFLKNGGILVYSTCTTEPDENEQVIDSFLKTHPDFELENPGQFVPQQFVQFERYVQTLPHIHQIDGSFAARLKKRVL